MLLFLEYTFGDIIVDNTKTINDVIQKLVDGNLGTTEQVKDILKLANPSVDWSF